MVTKAYYYFLIPVHNLHYFYKIPLNIIISTALKHNLLFWHFQAKIFCNMQF